MPASTIKLMNVSQGFVFANPDALLNRKPKSGAPGFLP